MLDQATQGYQIALQLFNEKKFKKSFIQLVQISTSCSKNCDFLYLLSEVQNELSDYAARAKTLKVLSEITQKVQDQLAYMKQLFNNKSINLALDVGLNLLNQNLEKSEKIVIYDLMSRIYIQENDFEGLSEIANAYQRDNILNEQYFFSLSLIALNQGSEPQALEHLRSAVSANQNFEEAWIALALLHDKMGDDDLSIANLEKALDINPLNASALKHYSKKSVHSGVVDKAVEKIKFYLQEFNFDQEITVEYVQLMKVKNQNDIVQRESEKLSYYFGQHISL